MAFFSALYKYFFSYTGMGALGLILCIVVSMLICYQKNLRPLRFLLIFILSILPTYLGAKLFGIVSVIAYKMNVGFPIVFSEEIVSAGIVYYGGMFAYLAYMRFVLPLFYKKKARRVYNCAALLVPLFHGFARLGCYCAHCCYGVVSELQAFASFYEHRVPVQLFEAGFELCLFLILAFLLLQKKLRRISVARLYLYSYSVFRFLIEFLRGDIVRGFIGPLSFSQWIAAGTLICLLFTRYRKGDAAL